MNNDLISRAEAIDIIRSMTINLGGKEIFHPEAKKSVVGTLDEIAAIDAVPVVRRSGGGIMPWPCEKTHRCAGSVRYEVSIRKNAAQSSWGKSGAYHGWTLWNRRYEPEYDSFHEMNIGTITFCPFCGERLEDT